MLIYGTYAASSGECDPKGFNPDRPRGRITQIATYSSEALHDRKQTHLIPPSAGRVRSELIEAVERQSRVHGTARRRVADGGQRRVRLQLFFDEMHGGGPGARPIPCLRIGACTRCS